MLYLKLPNNQSYPIYDTDTQTIYRLHNDTTNYADELIEIECRYCTLDSINIDERDDQYIADLNLTPQQVQDLIKELRNLIERWLPQLPSIEGK